MRKKNRFNIIFIPMLPTLYGRRYKLSKFLAQNNNVHFILWEMPYPVNFKNIFNSLLHCWRYEEYTMDKINIHKIIRFPFFMPIINSYLFKIQIRKIFKREKIDVIISQSFFNETEPPKDLPIIFDYNDNYQTYAEIYGSFLYKLSYKILQVNKTVTSQIKRAKAVLAVSDILFDKALKINSNVYKVTNGVDSIALRYKATCKKNNSMIYVSTFGKWSGLTEIINAVYVLRNEISDIQLHLVGDGTELASAKKLVKKMSLSEYVIFHGKINNRKKLYDLINSCELCLNMSEKNIYRDSSSPIKIFDYSGLGKKIVSTNISEVLALNFPNIFIYNYNNREKELPIKIKMALESNISNSQVRSEIKKFYTWEVLTKKIEYIISSLHKKNQII